MARRQIEALREQRAFAEELRSWRESVIRNLEKAKVKRAKKAAKKKVSKKDRSRGVYRVPAHLQGLAVTVTPVELAEHGVPYVNPDRDEKRHARLRKDTPQPWPQVKPSAPAPWMKRRPPVLSGRQALFGSHPWRRDLIAAKNGSRTQQTDDTEAVAS